MKKQSNAFVSIYRDPKTNCLLLHLSNSLTFICYVGADFAGLWRYEDDQDPVCVQSHLGYVIMFTNCPLLWASKLQTEIAVCTMEAEYIALLQSMHDLLPLCYLTLEILNNLHLPFTGSWTHSKCFEDSNGALTL